MSLHYQIERLLNFAIQQGLIAESDIIYMRNQYLELFDLNYQKITIEPEHLEYADEILTTIYHILDKDHSLILNYLGKTKDRVSCRIMNMMLNKPSEMIAKFEKIKEAHGIKAALDYWFKLNILSHYIKVDNLNRNKHWLVETDYGQMEITINRAKPEKDPAEIALLKKIAAVNNEYPKCLLCIENEGYAGSYTNPARQNHRLIPIKLSKETWYFQFSPYVYYNQHSVIVNQNHIDMKIDANTFKAFFDFVDLFPHYMIGSNADIPIVGGSILTHDHYQAGVHVFPIEKAVNRFTFKLPKYPDVDASVVEWPISTIRLIGNRRDLQKLVELVLEKWKTYNNPQLEIIAYTDDIPHNAITPIMRKLGKNKYRVDLLLRNNRTSEKHPTGIFHPHSKLHHIKKENLGLIEAMGFAILPGRLNHELNNIKQLLANNDVEIIKRLQPESDIYKHRKWVLELFDKYGSFIDIDLENLLKVEIGNKFTKILSNAGVFKNTPSGNAGIKDFISYL